MSLAAQLANIAAPKQQGTQKRNTRASILYTPREAADLSLDHLHETAQNAFVELCRVDPHLESFEAALFSPSARNTNRELNDPDTNAQLDVDLGNFARAVSPYLLLSATPHVLEYLVRRFEIHLYNVESLLECILPFHETSLFAKIVPLLALQTDSRWSFLHKVQQSRVPMARQTVVDAAVRNVAVVDFVWSMAQRVVGSDVGSSSSKTRKHDGSQQLLALSASAAKSTLTFCTIVLVETSRKVHAFGGEAATSYIRRSLPHLIHSIGTKRSTDYATMGYILSTQLCRSFAVSADIYHALSTAVANSVLCQVVHSKKKHKNKNKNKTKNKNKSSTGDDAVLLCDATTLHRALTCLASMHTVCDGRTAAPLALPSAVIDLLGRHTSNGNTVLSQFLALSSSSKQANQPPVFAAPILSMVSSFVRQAVAPSSSSTTPDLTAVMAMMKTLSCGHLVQDVLFSCVRTTRNDGNDGNDGHARTLARWYPEEMNAAIRAVVAQATNQRDHRYVDRTHGMMHGTYNSYVLTMFIFDHSFFFDNRTWDIHDNSYVLTMPIF